MVKAFIHILHWLHKLNVDANNVTIYIFIDDDGDKTKVTSKLNQEFPYTTRSNTSGTIVGLRYEILG